MKALKMRSALAGRRKVTATNWEDHWIWSPYNYTRSCRRTHCWLFYGCSAFKTNWKGEKPQYVGASCCCSVAKLCLIFLWPHGLQHARLPCPPLFLDFAQVHVSWVSDAIYIYSHLNMIPMRELYFPSLYWSRLWGSESSLDLKVSGSSAAELHPKPHLRVKSKVSPSFSWPWSN